MKGKLRCLVNSMSVGHISALCVLLTLAAIAGILLLRPSFRPAVNGEASEQEVSEILRAVRQDMWKAAFPDHSWATIRRSPRALWAVMTARVFEVRRQFRDRALVIGRFQLNQRLPALDFSELPPNSWLLSISSGQWLVSGRGFVIAQQPWRTRTQSFDEGQRFLGSLSNESRQFLSGRPLGADQSLSLAPRTRALEP